jgi:hypothetical protein
VDYSFLSQIPGAILKPTSRKTLKGRKDRAEYKTKAQVRAECVERDGYCRIAEMAHRTLCAGRSEWMHLEEGRRSQTRGMAPEKRHTTRLSLMGCKRHHLEYDAHVFDVDFIDPERGADGALQVTYR